MDIKFHNTKTGRKETFKPANKNHVTMYVCGPTVYDLIHIGNGRPAVIFDVLYRLLNCHFPQVTYVRNITDIDDKINSAALKENISISEITNTYIIAYKEDLQRLEVLDPSIEPRATDHISEITKMIEILIKGNHAYEAEGHVLFEVMSDPGYGELSRKNVEDLLAGARVDVAPYKKDPRDFILWKPSDPGLPGWDSPWGRGRPGWHIECSAMISKHLGSYIDIHGGGSDLTFPHHENESAQSRCAHNLKDSVGYWLHNGMLKMGSEKMSKSLGNIVTLRSLLNQYSGEVVRYALLSAHYRSPLTWSADLLEQAQASLNRFYQSLLTTNYKGSTSAEFQDIPIKQFPENILDALNDDLNTPQALAAMHEIASEINRSSNSDHRNQLAKKMLASGRLLGLLNKSAIEYFQQTKSVDTEEINRLIEAREDARRDKDFSAADKIREQLAVLGVEIEDTKDGTRWKIAIKDQF